MIIVQAPAKYCRMTKHYLVRIVDSSTWYILRNQLLFVFVSPYSQSLFSQFPWLKLKRFAPHTDNLACRHTEVLIPGSIHNRCNVLRGEHSKEDLRHTQKPINFPIFADNIWSYLLWSPVIVHVSGKVFSRIYMLPCLVGAAQSARARTLYLLRHDI